MECYSEQIVAMAADGELAAEEARRLRDHLATCRPLPATVGRITR